MIKSCTTCDFQYTDVTKGECGECSAWSNWVERDKNKSCKGCHAEYFHLRDVPCLICKPSGKGVVANG